ASSSSCRGCRATTWCACVSSTRAPTANPTRRSSTCSRGPSTICRARRPTIPERPLLEVERALEVGGGGGSVLRHLQGDPAGLEHVGEVLIEGLHAVVAAALLDHVLEVAGPLRIPDVLLHGLGLDHDLQGHHPAVAVGLGQEALGDGGLEVIGEPV